MTIKKLESQFEQVDRAFAWILMRRFVISAGLGDLLVSVLSFGSKEVREVSY